MHSSITWCDFAVAFEMQWRVWAAAQHSSSELGSALTFVDLERDSA
ncbi:MAG: hypothetical protein ACI3YO_07275 [Prevotella sp.]